MNQAILTTAEIEAYHRDGFVMPDYRLPDRVLDALREAYDRIVTENTDTMKEMNQGLHNQNYMKQFQNIKIQERFIRRN